MIIARPPQPGLLWLAAMSSCLNLFPRRPPLQHTRQACTLAISDSSMTAKLHIKKCYPSHPLHA